MAPPDIKLILVHGVAGALLFVSFFLEPYTYRTAWGLRAFVATIHLLGYITEYDEVNVGIYRSRSVAGTFFMWNKKNRKKIWEADNKIKTSKWATSDSKILSNFLGGLGKGFMDRIKNKPLAMEAERFVRISLEGLPFKP